MLWLLRCNKAQHILHSHQPNKLPLVLNKNYTGPAKIRHDHHQRTRGTTYPIRLNSCMIISSGKAGVAVIGVCLIVMNSISSICDVDEPGSPTAIFVAHFVNLIQR